MESLRATFEVVTPVFCGGADQKGPSAIRPMSMRGALRFWYRALDGEFRENEPKHFGAASDKTSTASPMTLRVGEVKLQANRNLGGQYGGRPPHYFGYFLYAGSNERLAIVPDASPDKNRFGVQLDARWPGDLDRTRKAWAAALWLFGHLGGLGARSRRAFGTLALVDWPGTWEGIRLPRPAHGAETAQQWVEQFAAGMKTLREWFPRSVAQRHEHQAIDDGFWLALPREGRPRASEALDEAAALISRVHTPAEGNNWHADLCALGLPRRFSNGDVATTKGDRSGSRLHIRVIRVGPAYHPLFAWLDAPLVPSGQSVTINRNPRDPGPAAVNKLRRLLDESGSLRYPLRG